MTNAPVLQSKIYPEFSFKFSTIDFVINILSNCFAFYGNHATSLSFEHLCGNIALPTHTGQMASQFKYLTKLHSKVSIKTKEKKSTILSSSCFHFYFSKDGLLNK